MKFGVRKPSLKKSIKARTTGRVKRAVKSSVNPLYGKKGMGLINDPKKAMYNKVYNKTTVSAIPKINNKTTFKNPINKEKEQFINNNIKDDKIPLLKQRYLKYNTEINEYLYDQKRLKKDLKLYKITNIICIIAIIMTSMLLLIDISTFFLFLFILFLTFLNKSRTKKLNKWLEIAKKETQK